MKDSILGREDGYVLILAMAVLLVLTILGIAGVKNSTVELQIAGNERISTVNFYYAEGAAYEGAQKVMNEDDNETLLPALNPSPTDTDLIKTAAEENDVELVDNANLDQNDDGEFTEDDLAKIATATVDTVADSDVVVKNLVTLNQIPSGSSLALGASRLYDYSVYGYGEKENKGNVLVKVGVKKRF